VTLLIEASDHELNCPKPDKLNTLLFALNSLRNRNGADDQSSKEWNVRKIKQWYSNHQRTGLTGPETEQKRDQGRFALGQALQNASLQRAPDPV